MISELETQVMIELYEIRCFFMLRMHIKSIFLSTLLCLGWLEKRSSNSLVLLFLLSIHFILDFQLSSWFFHMLLHTKLKEHMLLTSLRTKLIAIKYIFFYIWISAYFWYSLISVSWVSLCISDSRLLIYSSIHILPWN